MLAVRKSMLRKSMRQGCILRTQCLFLLPLLFSLFLFSHAVAQTNASALLLEVDGPIGPATTEYLSSAMNYAEVQNHSLIVIRLDTPGGLTESTRDIVKLIRASSIPVATWVAPEGARAASAGTYILYGSHIAAMAPATNLGAATPVSIGPTSPSAPTQPQPASDPEDRQGNENRSGNTPTNTDEESAQTQQTDQQESAQPNSAIPLPGSASERKAINDAAAWIRGLAQATGRNVEWAEQAVREGVSITAEEALSNNVIDVIAGSLDTLLSAIDGREVSIKGEPKTLVTSGLTIERQSPGWRSRVLAVITNPTLAYMLLMLGIYGLLLEGYNPGSLVPGTIGAIALLTALYAFQILPVNYAGLLLIFLGIGLMIAEAFVPSFGILGIGGLSALVIGSIILMDTEAPGFEIAIEMIAAIALGSGLGLALLITLAVKAWRRPVMSGSNEILHATGEAITNIDETQGQVWVLSERWQARSQQYIPQGTQVRVVGRDGLVLSVALVPAESQLEATT